MPNLLKSSQSSKMKVQLKNHIMSTNGIQSPNVVDQEMRRTENSTLSQKPKDHKRARSSKDAKKMKSKKLKKDRSMSSSNVAMTSVANKELVKDS